jgi:UDP-glucose 4-epimerase
VQGVYAIAHPRGWTLPDLAAAVSARFGPFGLDLPAEPTTGFAGFRHVRPAATDLSAARRELGFGAAHDLTDTLAHWWPLDTRPA